MRLIPPTIADTTRSDGERVVFDALAATSAARRAGAGGGAAGAGRPAGGAAAGPDTFDCSGLMVFAYGKVGIGLSHYSGAQINEGSPVSRDNLQPGDLVFFGSPIHHVGMYAGGGNFIEAPYSGTDVRITELSNRSDFAGASRPQ